MEKYRTLLKYRTIFKSLKIQEEIVILQEMQELQDSVPRLYYLHIQGKECMRIIFSVTFIWVENMDLLILLYIALNVKKLCIYCLFMTIGRSKHEITITNAVSKKKFYE